MAQNPFLNAPLKELEFNDEFVGRHIGPKQREVASMLEVIGAPSIQALIEKTVPASILRTSALNLPEAATEQNALQEIARYAARNQIFKSYIGMGYHDTFTPNVILRNVLENPGWYTAYTP